MKKDYFKLVRDKIPEFVKCTYRHLDDIDYELTLRNKLVEEATELKWAITTEEIIEECADVLEVMFAIMKYYDIDLCKVLQKQTFKREEKGGFENRIFLESVED